MQDTGFRRYKTLIIGAGPAGTGPLVCALQQGRLAALLDAGVAIVDRGPTIGHGTIGQYIINSDTLGGTFLECLAGPGEEAFRDLLDSPTTRLIQQNRAGAVPLATVGAYMGELGVALRRIIDAHPASRFFPRTQARAVRRLPEGGFATELLVTEDGGQREMTVYSETVVFAMGASQSRERTLAEELVPGVDLRPYDERIMLTNEVLTAGGVAEIERRLCERPAPRVVIVGGSHSALSSAWTLLNKTRLPFEPGAITLLHREKLKVFYPTREAALAEGYTDFSDEDFCPVTGRLYRLGGFRLDSRELVMRLLGMIPERPEPRVRLARLRPAEDDPAAIRALLDAADLIIPAFGYRPNTVPLYEADGAPVRLLCQEPGPRPLVDERGRVMDATSRPVPGVFGIGLASGFKLSGKLGGEPSFRGQTNGLWLYQNGVGEIILDQVAA